MIASVTDRTNHFRNKAFAALLASVAGAVGANRVYLGQRLWWLPPALTAATLPFVLGVANWYQTAPFFLLMVPVVAGFIQALAIALMPDDRFDAQFNAGHARRNQSGWAAVLVAVSTLLGGGVVLVSTIALATQTYFENALRATQ